ncbi:hypothetical protein KUTeg_000087 [Tegillarca granosa]|uniref:NmrA-like family domain-containing protein 1 n=1 Tax=Tegillarca granosa TaxID=220873 RepID=A0ABQ9FXY9_TEGGR|nr:hypothetical protein KUTeg_000087 [Tegillarca granosa]
MICLSYTIVRLPFWYENFATVFKPHKIKHGVYALPLPLEGGTIDAMSVEDAGECIYEILLRYKQYTNKVIGLTADRINMDSILESFNKHIGNRKFKDPKIRIKDYEKFTFAGAQDLASMFEFYCKGIAQA